MTDDQFSQMATKLAELEDRIRQLEAKATPYGVGSAGATPLIEGLAEAVAAKYAGTARP